MTYIRRKQLWLAEPVKRLREEEGEPENLQDILVHSLAALPIFSNLLGPLALINAGIRPHKIFQGSHMMPNPLKFNQLFPVFRYYNPPSPAYRTGAGIGGAIGGTIMKGLGHVTPFVGWMPMSISKRGIPRNLTKLQLSPWIKKAGVKHGAKIGGKIGSRLIPGLGWAMLAYDAYDVTVNRRLWGFDL